MSYLGQQVTQVAITAQNQFSPIVRIRDKKFSVSVRSTAMNATVVLQRKLPSEANSAENWRDVASWTANKEAIVESAGAWDYRIGTKTGGFTSATALVAQIVS